MMGVDDIGPVSIFDVFATVLEVSGRDFFSLSRSVLILEKKCQYGTITIIMQIIACEVIVRRFVEMS